MSKFISILILVNIVSAVKIYDNTKSNKIEIGKELEFTIDFGKKILTADFSIQFDSEKLEYSGSSTKNLKTNMANQNEFLGCYYDLEKIGIDKITLIFKTKAETNKTNIKITNITIHTETAEETIADIISENIKIVKPYSDLSNSVLENNLIENNNALNNATASNKINNEINNVEQNNKKEENKKIQ